SGGQASMKTTAVRAFAILVAFFLAAPSGRAQAPAAPGGAAASAVLRADQPGPVVNKNIYGHFAEHLGRGIYEGIWVGPSSPIPHTRGIRNDVVAALKELKIPVLRWPGGCFADEYHWKDGIGPREKRPSMINTHWGNVEENNHFGTHEFMDLCEVLGAEPYVNGNVGSGTVQEMSEWVEYLTRDGDSPMVALRKGNGREQPWRVPFWGIGNEAWGCGGNMRAEAYADAARRYATFCRDHDDNRLTRIAAGAADDDVSWTRALMEAISCFGCTREPRGTFQAVSFHYYTHAGEGIHTTSATQFAAEQYYGTIAKAADIDRVIRAHSAVMDVFDPGRKVGLVCDEWGTWWTVEPGTNPGFLYQQNTLRDALVAGLHFDVFHNHAARLRMANIAQTLNVLQAMILTDDDGGLVLTPTYHVFEMNTGHHDARLLPTHLLETPTRSVGDSELPMISMSASSKDGQALISVSNLDLDSAARLQLDLRGVPLGSVSGRLLTADAAQSHNTVAAPTVVAPTPLEVAVDQTLVSAVLPAHSFATIAVGLSGS
ncbi:MAG TPA: alpha-L-arabinofuranosidase C-terminal domain-containing protein, partial [Microlunatus sp.]|nr:alpha-L-arabinofuranosidase C-terminal domain-containing protein [Microlunatus sp.]